MRLNQRIIKKPQNLIKKNHEGKNMSVIENIIDIPMEHEKNVFGQFDYNIKKIEKTLHVTIISRDGQLKIIGGEVAAQQNCIMQFNGRWQDDGKKDCIIHRGSSRLYRNWQKHFEKAG